MRSISFPRLAPLATSARRGLGALHASGSRVGWVGIMVLMITSPAFAQTTSGSSPATILSNICTFILGSFGQSLAVLGIIAIGLSWMFGRASLGLIAGVVGGIVIMFGASYLGQTLIGSGT